MDSGYVLEAVRFITNKEEWQAKNGKQEHASFQSVVIDVTQPFCVGKLICMKR